MYVIVFSSYQEPESRESRRVCRQMRLILRIQEILIPRKLSATYQITLIYGCSIVDVEHFEGLSVH